MIETLVTKKSVNVFFNDGHTRKGQLIKDESENFRLLGAEGDHVFNVAELADKEAQTSKQNVKPIKYSGSLDIGLSRSSGNEEDEDYHGKLQAKARTLHNRYTLELEKNIQKNEGDKTQDEKFLSMQLDHFINQKWCEFASVSFEEDYEELLDLRSTYSIGSGYQFLERDDLQMNGEIGLAYVDEDFQEDEDNQYAGGRWAFNYEQRLFSWVAAFHDHEEFFSVENTEDINIRSSSGFKFPLNDHINAKLQANIDWNKTPADGADSTDKEYIFTLGYEF